MLIILGYVVYKRILQEAPSLDRGAHFSCKGCWLGC